MKALDTSAWIEWLIASQIGEAVLAEVPGLTPLLVPTVVQYGLAKWLTGERGEDECASIMAFIAATCTVASLDSEIALDAADIGAMHRLATADAIIYATAFQNAAPSIICGAHFRGLPGVVFILGRLPVARLSLRRCGGPHVGGEQGRRSWTNSGLSSGARAGLAHRAPDRTLLN